MLDLVTAFFLLTGLIATLRKPWWLVGFLHSMAPRGAKFALAIPHILLAVAVIGAMDEWRGPRMRRWVQSQFECQRFIRRFSHRITRNA